MGFEGGEDGGDEGEVEVGLVEGCGEEVEDFGVGYYFWGLLGKGEVGRWGGD